MSSFAIRTKWAPRVGTAPAWHGQYMLDGKWRTVRNGMGLPIAYASRGAAFDGAMWTVRQLATAAA